MNETPVPAALLDAVAGLWRIPPPGPNNLLYAPPFVHLRETCESLYGEARSKTGLGFALRNALHSLGIPCALARGKEGLALPADKAAGQLDAAFRQKEAKRLYLCPLDMADDNLPLMKFGPNSVRKLTRTELEALVDFPRLTRTNPNWTLDVEVLSEFRWLVIEETCRHDREPGERAIPLWYQKVDLNEDRGRIEPHKERFPAAVEAALFAILRAPWEDWSEEFEFDWRSFNVPWFYEVNRDIFVRPAPPFSPDKLSWEWQAITFPDGKVDEVVERIRHGLKAAVVGASAWLNDETWSELERARQSLLFPTQIAYFFVRAFLSEPLDEFLAHILTIEAALGLQSDYDAKARRRVTRRKRLWATDCMVARVSALLGETEGGTYRSLFKKRSLFLHGRDMDAIPGEDRIDARRLARRVVNGIIDAALTDPGLQSREDYLGDLLERGLPYLRD